MPRTTLATGLVFAAVIAVLASPAAAFIWINPSGTPVLIAVKSTSDQTHLLPGLRVENEAPYLECDNGLTYCRGVTLELSAVDGRRFLIFGEPTFTEGPQGQEEAVGFRPLANLGLGHTGVFNGYFVRERVHWLRVRPDGALELRAVKGPVQINCPTGTPYGPETSFQVCDLETGEVLFEVPQG